jgi:curli biogenesis system outer membrane secretion channel CsgG
MVKKLLPIFTSLLIFNSCATYVNVKIQKPASISLGNVKNVAVMDVADDEFIGSYSFTEVGDAPLSEKLETIIEGKKKPKSPDLKNAYSGKTISDKLVTKLVGNGHYTVADRDKLDKVLEEQQLSLSGIISEDDAPEIGELIGVDAFIIGSGKYFINDKGGWYTNFNDKKIFKDFFYMVDRKVNVEINFKIISVENGQVIASLEKKKSKTLNAKGDDLETAFANLSNWQSTMDKLVNDILNKIIKQIAPYYKKTSKMIKSGTSIGMKTGLKYAKRNMWEDAKTSWEQVLEDFSPNGIKDKISAMYNLGVYYEIKDELDKAEEIFDNCFKQSGKNEYLDARLRVQKRKKELVKLKEQNVE